MSKHFTMPENWLVEICVLDGHPRTSDEDYKYDYKYNYQSKEKNFKEVHNKIQDTLQE
jgi:hypothetical protein